LLPSDDELVCAFASRDFSRYASGGSGLSGGSSGDDSDPPQSPSSEAPPTAARAQTQPRAKSTITAADSLEEEFGTFQSQRTESALLAQVKVTDINIIGLRIR